MREREFQAIQDEDQRVRVSARVAVEEGKLQDVEITPDALKSYLDKRLSADGRMGAFSYDYTARLLRTLGFQNFAQIDQCIAGYDDDRVSRLTWGGRQGQITRFEEMLRAGMGDQFKQKHPWKNQEWFADRHDRFVQALETAGVDVRAFDPSAAQLSG